jgi:3D (Asp-Asp-Asp) domain-containing protein
MTFRTVAWGDNRPTSPFHWLRDLAADAAELFPIAAFLFVSCVPAEALTFAQLVEGSHRPLFWARTSASGKSAILGISSQPEASPSSHIPVATTAWAPGVAVRVMATAYSSTADQTDGNPFMTASGTRVGRGTLAANFLPFGTRVRIGNETFTVTDRMGGQYNNRLIVDKWVASREEAIQFGVRVVEMEIISLP